MTAYRTEGLDWIYARTFLTHGQTIEGSTLLARVCTHIFQEEPEVEFSGALMDYLRQREEFSDDWMQLSMWADTFEKQVMWLPWFQYHGLILIYTEL